MADQVVLSTLPHVPIAQLNQELHSNSSTTIKAIVTLTWPYSSATGAVAFLLAEPDFRLRKSRGQVRVQFAGVSAQAVAKAGIASGDEVILSLDGVKFLPDEIVGERPGHGVEFELRFAERLLLQYRQEASDDLTTIDVDHPVPESEVEIRAPSPEPPRSPVISLMSRVGLQNRNEWSSPAFKRSRSSYGSLLGLDFENYAKADGSTPGIGRKRARLSSTWRFSSRSPSPGIEETVDLEPSEGSPTPPIPTPEAMPIPEDYNIETSNAKALPQSPLFHNIDTLSENEANGVAQITTDNLAPVQSESDPMFLLEEHHESVNAAFGDSVEPVESSFAPTNDYDGVTNERGVSESRLDQFPSLQVESLEREEAEGIRIGAFNTSEDAQLLPQNLMGHWQSVNEPYPQLAPSNLDNGDEDLDFEEVEDSSYGGAYDSTGLQGSGTSQYPEYEDNDLEPGLLVDILYPKLPNEMSSPVAESDTAHLVPTYPDLSSPRMSGDPVELQTHSRSRSPSRLSDTVDAMAHDKQEFEDDAEGELYEDESASEQEVSTVEAEQQLDEYDSVGDEEDGMDQTGLDDASLDEQSDEKDDIAREEQLIYSQKQRSDAMDEDSEENDENSAESAVGGFYSDEDELFDDEEEGEFESENDYEDDDAENPESLHIQKEAVVIDLLSSDDEAETGDKKKDEHDHDSADEDISDEVTQPESKTPGSSILGVDQNSNVEAEPLPEAQPNDQDDTGESGESDESDGSGGSNDEQDEVLEEVEDEDEIVLKERVEILSASTSIEKTNDLGQLNLSEEPAITERSSVVQHVLEAQKTELYGLQDSINEVESHETINEDLVDKSEEAPEAHDTVDEDFVKEVVMESEEVNILLEEVVADEISDGLEQENIESSSQHEPSHDGAKSPPLENELQELETAASDSKLDDITSKNSKNSPSSIFGLDGTLDQEAHVAVNLSDSDTVYMNTSPAVRGTNDFIVTSTKKSQLLTPIDTQSSQVLDLRGSSPESAPEPKPEGDNKDHPKHPLPLVHQKADDDVTGNTVKLLNNVGNVLEPESAQMSSPNDLEGPQDETNTVIEVPQISQDQKVSPKTRGRKSTQSPQVTLQSPRRSQRIRQSSSSPSRAALTAHPKTPPRKPIQNADDNDEISFDISHDEESPVGHDASIEMAIAALNSPMKPLPGDLREGETVPDLKMRTIRNLRLELPEYTSLKLLRYNLEKKLDIVAIATNDTPDDPHKLASGLGHYHCAFNITDPSIAPAGVTEVQISRPYQEALPIVKAGDGILLHNFVVHSQKDKGFILRSEKKVASSWAVFRDDEEEADIRGPPVEYDEREKRHIAGMKEWYASLDSTAVSKIARANVLKSGGVSGKGIGKAP